MKNTSLKIVKNNTPANMQLNTREMCALSLCRRVLEEVEPYYADRLTVTKNGEIITLNSAVEILDDVIVKAK